MIILPVPPSRPCIRMRARFAFTPELVASYPSIMALTAGVIAIFCSLIRVSRASVSQQRLRYNSARRGQLEQQAQIVPLDPFVGDQRPVKVLVLDAGGAAAKRQIKVASSTIGGDDVKQRAL